MTFLDSPRINIRKYVYLIHENKAEFLHTFLSIEQARAYCENHHRTFGRSDTYEIREVDVLVETISFHQVGNVT